MSMKTNDICKLFYQLYYAEIGLLYLYYMYLCICIMLFKNCILIIQNNIMFRVNLIVIYTNEIKSKNILIRIYIF